MKKLCTSDSGQTTIEMVLVMPLLFALLLGAMEYGRLWYISIEVTSAATAGVEYGSQNHAVASDFSGMQNVAMNDGLDIQTVKPSGIAATATHFCTPNNSCSGTNQTEYVQVNTQVSVDSLFNSYFRVTPYVLHGQAIMRVRE